MLSYHERRERFRSLFFRRLLSAERSAGPKKTIPELGPTRGARSDLFQMTAILAFATTSAAWLLAQRLTMVGYKQSHFLPGWYL